MKEIQIYPLSTVFFRDGKPFTMGLDNFGSSVFPPLPTTYQGMIRSIYIAHEFNGNVAKINSPIEDESINLNITSSGLLLTEPNNSKPIRLFPAPLDLHTKPEPDLGLMYLQMEKGLIGSQVLDYVLKCTITGKIKPVEGKAYLKEQDFIQYLNTGDMSEINPVWESEHVVKEVKVGIGMDHRTRQVKKGMLYKIQMNRLEKRSGFSLCFFAHFEGLNKFKHIQGITRIGGEGKMAEYRIDEISGNSIKADEVQFNSADEVIVKMYLATPALFESGWLPESIEENYSVKIIAAVIGRNLNVGGWDMRKKKAKPMFRAVPAGSVYYLHGAYENIKEVIQLNGTCLPCDIDEYKQIGFGQVYFSKPEKINK